MEDSKAVLSAIFGVLTNGFIVAFGTVAYYAFQYKLIVTIITVVFLLAYRLLLANLLYVKRKDKAQWIIWGVLIGVTVINFFIKIDIVYLITEIAIWTFAILYACRCDKTRAVKSVIYSNNIVYEDNSDRFDNNSGENQEKKNRQKAKDALIRRGFKISMYHMRMGMPVVTTKYVFKVSAMATEEQLSKVVAILNRYFDEYNWRKQKQKNGVKVEFTAEIKTNKIQSVPFNKDISDELDWCIVPCGAIDVSTKANAEATPYVWQMQNPKKEGKAYKCLENTKLFTPGPHAFVVGQTGGGKSVLINSMIAHWVNKAKTNRQVDLYLADAKRVEFAPYECLEEVAGVAFTLQEAVDLTNEFCEEMLKRNEIMQKEGIKDIPLDGKLTLKKSININGHIIKGSDVIEFKTKDGRLHRDRAMNLANRDDIAEVNIPEEKNEDTEEDNKRDRRREPSMDW